MKFSTSNCDPACMPCVSVCSFLSQNWCWLLTFSLACVIFILFVPIPLLLKLTQEVYSIFDQEGLVIFFFSTRIHIYITAIARFAYFLLALLQSLSFSRPLDLSHFCSFIRDIIKNQIYTEHLNWKETATSKAIWKTICCNCLSICQGANKMHNIRIGCRTEGAKRK